MSTLLVLIELLNILLIIVMVLEKSGYQIIFPVLWWTLWTSMGIFFPIGYYETNSFISCLAASFPLFLVLGYAVAKGWNYIAYASIPSKKYRIYLSKIRIKNLSFWFAFVLVPYLIFLSYEFVVLLRTVEPETVRSLIFTDESPYYTNKYFEYLISCYIKPMVLAMVWLSVFFYIKKLRFNSFLILTIFSVFIITTTEMGRFGFYIVFQCLLLLIFEGERSLFKQKSLILIFFAFILAVTYYRSAADENLLELVYRVYILTYHTLFIGILNHDYVNNTITNGYYTIGMSTVFSILDPIVIVFKSVGLIEYVPESGVLGKDLDYTRYLGVYDNGEYIYGNAFGSIIYGMYRDFGLFGPPFFAIILGMTLRNPAKINQFAIPVNYLLFFGIFQQILSFPFFMSLIIYKLSLSYVTKDCKP